METGSDGDDGTPANEDEGGRRRAAEGATDAAGAEDAPAARDALLDRADAGAGAGRATQTEEGDDDVAVISAASEEEKEPLESSSSDADADDYIGEVDENIGGRDGNGDRLSGTIIDAGGEANEAGDEKDDDYGHFNDSSSSSSQIDAGGEANDAGDEKDDDNDHGQFNDSSSSSEPDQVDNTLLLSRVAAGSRLEVYWPAAGAYRPCTVLGRSPGSYSIHALQYDEGDIEEVDLEWEVFRLLEERRLLPPISEEGGSFGSPVSQVLEGEHGPRRQSPSSSEDEGYQDFLAVLGGSPGPSAEEAKDQSASGSEPGARNVSSQILEDKQQSPSSSEDEGYQQFLAILEGSSPGPSSEEAEDESAARSEPSARNDVSMLDTSADSLLRRFPALAEYESNGEWEEGAVEPSEESGVAEPADISEMDVSTDIGETTIDNTALLSAVSVGKRLEVYWAADSQYHACTVTGRDSDGAIHRLRYDDGSMERVDLTWEIFRLRGDDDAASLAVTVQDTSVAVGGDRTSEETTEPPEDQDESGVHGDDDAASLADTAQDTSVAVGGDRTNEGGTEPPEDQDLPEPPGTTSLAPSGPDDSPEAILNTSLLSQASAGSRLEVPEPVDNTALLSNVSVGTRLEIFWPADGRYHMCVVTSRDSAGIIHTLIYDDGSVETIDLTWEIFRLSDQDDSGVHEGGIIASTQADNIDEEGDAAEDQPGTVDSGAALAMAADVSTDVGETTIDNTALLFDVTVGTRIEVYWPSDSNYHPCVVTGRDAEGVIHALQYDDGTTETIDLTWEVFRLLDEDNDARRVAGAIALNQVGDVEEGGDMAGERVEVEYDIIAAPDVPDDVDEGLAPYHDEGEQGHPLLPTQDNTHTPLMIEEGMSHGHGVRDGTLDDYAELPWWQQKRNKALLDIVAIVAVITIVIIVATLLNRSNQSSSDSTSPTTSPTADIW